MGRNVAANLDHRAVASHRDHVDGKPHPECMDALRWGDHESVRVSEVIAPEETLPAAGAIGRDLDRPREAGIATLHRERGAGRNCVQEMRGHGHLGCKNQAHNLERRSSYDGHIRPSPVAR